MAIILKLVDDIHVVNGRVLLQYLSEDNRVNVSGESHSGIRSSYSQKKFGKRIGKK